MIYHYVITVSVCLPRRWWQRRVRRSFHTTSGHVRVPGAHTERAIYDRILEAAAQAAGVGVAQAIVLFFRLAPELAAMSPADPAPESDPVHPNYPVEDEEPGVYDEHP